METITLLGAEDVQRAGQRMREAAELMQRSASQIDDALERHRVYLDEWLRRFEDAVADMGRAAGAIGG